MQPQPRTPALPGQEEDQPENPHLKRLISSPLGRCLRAFMRARAFIDQELCAHEIILLRKYILSGGINEQRVAD